MAQERYKNYIRSKNLIRDAFSQLIDQKRDITKVNVREIIAIAGISKSTFYCHYKNVYAIADEIEAELLADFNAITKEDLVVEKIVKTYKKNEKTFKLMYSTNHNEKFTFRLRDLLVDKVLKESNYLKNEEANARQFKTLLLVNCILFSTIDYLKGNTLEKDYDSIDKILKEVIEKLR